MSEEFKLRIFDVGQGDAIVGILPDKRRAFIVDVYDARPVLRYLDAEGIAEVVLFLSHSDADHTRGVGELLTGIGNRRLLAVIYNRDRLLRHDQPGYIKLLRQLANAAKPRAHKPMSVSFDTNLNRDCVYTALFPDEIRVRIIYPEHEDLSALITQRPNETSGVLMVEHRISSEVTKRVMLAADIQLTAISIILSRLGGADLMADVFKYPHHGSWPTGYEGIKFAECERRTMAEFVELISPKAVIFSVGWGNDDGHVRPEAFEMLRVYQQQTGNLEQIRCTEYTLACTGAPAKVTPDELQGPHCAGDIEIRTGAHLPAGGLEITTAVARHDARVAELHSRSGCARCTFLPGAGVASPPPAPAPA